MASLEGVPAGIIEKNECTAQCRWNSHGRTAGSTLTDDCAERVLALVFCGDTGLERRAKPDQGKSPTRSVWRFHVPRIWIRSIGLGGVGVKRKSQNLGNKFPWRLYLVVGFLGERSAGMVHSGGSGTEVL